MFENKVLVNLYALSLDRTYEIYVPVNEKIGNIIKLFCRILSLDENVNLYLINLTNGTLYKNNDLVRNVDIKNNSKLLLF